MTMWQWQALLQQACHLRCSDSAAASAASVTACVLLLQDQAKWLPAQFFKCSKPKPSADDDDDNSAEHIASA